MGKWDEFNKKYEMTAEDWKEWRETKEHYKKGGIVHCERCTQLIRTSPLITFLIRKGKIKHVLCSKCEQESLNE